MRVAIPARHSKTLLIALGAFLTGAGLFISAQSFAQSNSTAGPLGAVQSQSDPNPPACQAGYYPQEFVYQINSGSASSDISTDSSTWYECVTPAYLNPAPCMIHVSGSNTTGLHNVVMYKYANAIVSARLIEYANTGTGAYQSPNEVFDVKTLPTPNGNGATQFSLENVGEQHVVTLEVKNAAGQVNTCSDTIYRDAGDGSYVTQ